jgi:hypothetical protein
LRPVVVRSVEEFLSCGRLEGVDSSYRVAYSRSGKTLSKIPKVFSGMEDPSLTDAGGFFSVANFLIKPDRISNDILKRLLKSMLTFGRAAKNIAPIIFLYRMHQEFIGKAHYEMSILRQ